MEEKHDHEEINTYQKKNKREKREKLEPWRRCNQHGIHRNKVSDIRMNFNVG